MVFIGLFLFVFGYRLGFLKEFGDSYPYYDSWYNLSILQKSDSGEINLADLVAPYNGHRIALQRITNILLYKITGVWDDLQLAVVSALVLAISVGFGGSWMVKNGSSTGMVGIAVVPALSLSSFDNALWGFQLTFFYLYLFIIVFVICAVSSNQYTMIGLSAMIAALFTVGSGLGVACGGLIFSVWMSWVCRFSWKDSVARMLPILAVFLTGLLIFRTGCEELGSHNTRDFMVSLSKNLIWPWCLEVAGLKAMLLALFLWMPLLWLMIFGFLKRQFLGRLHLWSVCFGILIIVQAAGLAYGRGIGGVPPQVRYLDILSWSFWAQGVGWTVLVKNYKKKWMIWLCAFWMIVTLSGFWHMQIRAWQEGGPKWKLHLTEQRNVIAGYIESKYDPQKTEIRFGECVLSDFSEPIPTKCVRWAVEKKVLPQGQLGSPAEQGRFAGIIKILLRGAWVIAILGFALTSLGGNGFRKTESV